MYIQYPCPPKQQAVAWRHESTRRDTDEGTGSPAAVPCVCNTLRMVSRAVTQLYDDILRPSGLRVTQFSILGAIARLGDANLRQLEHTLAIDQTTLTRSLNLLERGGVIERVPRPDGRIKAMRLLWLLAVSLPDPAGAELRGGGPVADSAEARRPGEDGSSRRGHAGPPAAERGPELDLRTHGRR